MAAEKMRLGDMLVAAGLVARDQVDWALRRQKESGRRLGEELVELGFLTEVQLTQILSNQLSVPWVSLYHVEFSRELLDLVPAQLADRFTAVPVYVRSLRREGHTLFVALADPTDEDALAALRRSSGMPVKAMVAPPSEIRTAIRVYYFGGWRTPGAPLEPASSAPPGAGAEGSERPSGGPGEPPEDTTQPVPQDAAAELRDVARRTPAPVDERSTDVSELQPDTGPPGDGAAAARPPSMRLPARPGDRKMLSLTLLDGTVVRLPVKGPAAEEDRPEGAGLTATDLVAALRARAEGKDVSDVLGDEGWESLFAAMLTLLIRKGLIADWEFVEEWQRRRK